MASSLERLRAVSNVERLRAAFQPAPQPGFMDRLQGTADVLSRSGMPIMGAIARPREAAQTVLEGLGAAGGAALGTMTAGLPGAIVGGAGGARLGHAAGSAMFGETPEQEAMDAAGIAGAAGPAAGPVFRHTARIFGKLPTVAKAIEHAEVAAERTRRALVGSQTERVLARVAAHTDERVATEAAFIEKACFGPTGKPEVDAYLAKMSPERRKEFLDLWEKDLAKYAEILPRSLSKALSQAEQAVARGAAAVPVPEPTAGAIPGALGALLGGGSGGGMEGAIHGAAIGYVVGRMRSSAAYKLSNNTAFVHWATGLSPREPFAQALLSFTSDVLLRADGPEREIAGEFWEKGLDYIEEFPEHALGIAPAEGADIKPPLADDPGAPEALTAPEPERRTSVGPNAIPEPVWGRRRPGALRPLTPEQRYEEEKRGIVRELMGNRGRDI